MSEEFKLQYKTEGGKMRASFTEANKREAVIAEGLTEDGYIWLGCYPIHMRLDRPMAKAIGRALSRFANTGTLAEPTAAESLSNVAAAFDEEEQYYGLISEVAKRAREFKACKAALLGAYHDGHKPDGEYCHELQGHIHDAERALDKAVEALEVWLKEHESEAK